MMKKVNKNRPNISSEEIASKADFSSLMNQVAAAGGTSAAPATKSFLTKGWFIGGASALVATVGIAALMMSNPTEEVPQETIVADTTAAVLAEVTPEKQPFICPPVVGLDIPYTEYKVNGEQAKIIKYGTGSQVSIPANAFVDAQGNPVKGEVDIQYREFHDPIDFMLSGIPMNYDSAGFAYTFESAGMLEIKGYQNGEEVFIAPDKAINVEMVSSSDDSKFNLYYLDEEAEKWEYTGKPPVKEEPIAQESTLEPVRSEADMSIKEEGKMDLAIQVVVEEKADVQIIELEEHLAEVQQEIIQIQRTAPEEPKKPNDDNFRFNFDVDKAEFPELSSFKEVEFEVPANSKDFDASFYEVTWEDVQIEKAGDDKYKIVLTLGERVENVIVYPVFKDQSFKEAQKIFATQMKTYNKELDKRKMKEDIIKQQIAQRKAEIEEIRTNQAKQWATSQVSGNYKTKTKDNSAEASVGVIIRAFDVRSFGTWNCDTPIPPARGRQLAATFSDEEAKPMNAKNVFLIEKNVNAVFSYTKKQMNYFSWNPTADNYAFVVSNNGVLGIYSLERFKKIPDVKRFDFNMEMADRTFKTVEEVKEYFGV